MCTISITVFLSLIIFSFFRLKLLTMFFQQEEYNGSWFLKLVFNKGKLVDKRLCICLLIVLCLSFIDKNVAFIVPFLFLFFGIRENKVLKNSKKPLNITQRVKRILISTMCLVVICGLILTKLTCCFLSSILLIELLPLLLVLGNKILNPYEKHIQKKFLEEAKEKLKEINPIVIGVTGSYGKTSTKHILAHILSGNLPVLWTPGSVNTEMGVCRIIREKLLPQHKYFIVEIGAYFKGSIAKMCNFVKPKHGIITAIGEAHYEHFKSKETIAAAKFEIADYIREHNKEDGIIVVNSNQIEDRFIPNCKNIIRVGDNTNVFISNIEQTRDGLKFIYHNNGEESEIFAPIFGEHHAQNIACAITMALKLGMNISTIISTLKTLPQITHRLEVKSQANGVIIIDDAYNSNISGFKSGLNLLEKLKINRSILITPGMVELGKRHNESHYEIGKYAGQKADIVIVVASSRIPTFIDGFKSNNNDKELILVDTFAEANEWMKNNLKSGDVVLLENDLPDVYESKFCL